MRLKQRVRAGIHALRKRMSNKPEIELDFYDLPRLIRKSDPVILDIGCNDGNHTLAFLRFFENATVYCFEPDARAQKAFRERVRSKRAHLFEIALGNVDGEVDFHVSGGTPPPDIIYDRGGGWDLSGSIRKPKQHLSEYPWVSFDKVVPVKVARLDTWAREHKVNEIDFIWADVQGAEIDLIEGARETLQKTRYLYTEYSDVELYEGQTNLEGLAKLLPTFEVMRVYPADVLFRNTNVDTR